MAKKKVRKKVAKKAKPLGPVEAAQARKAKFLSAVHESKPNIRGV